MSWGVAVSSGGVAPARSASGLWGSPYPPGVSRCLSSPLGQWPLGLAVPSWGVTVSVQPARPVASGACRTPLELAVPSWGVAVLTLSLYRWRGDACCPSRHVHQFGSSFTFASPLQLTTGRAGLRQGIGFVAAGRIRCYWLRIRPVRYSHKCTWQTGVAESAAGCGMSGSCQCLASNNGFANVNSSKLTHVMSETINRAS